MKNKKAFSLVELIVVIALFSIIIFFLYSSLDMGEKTNRYFSDKLEKTVTSNELKKIFFLDLIHSDMKSYKIDENDQTNFILKLKTTNCYHNPFYNNISYLISKEKNLIRIESLKEFDKTDLNDTFFETAYIDILDKDIEKFKIIKQDQKLFFYIDKSNKRNILFSF